MAHFYGGERVIAAGRHTLQEVLVDGEHAAVPGEFRGVMRGGAEVDVGFADFLRYEGELIADRTTYFYKPTV